MRIVAWSCLVISSERLLNDPGVQNKLRVRRKGPTWAALEKGVDAIQVEAVPCTLTTSAQLFGKLQQHGESPRLAGFGLIGWFIHLLFVRLSQLAPCFDFASPTITTPGATRDCSPEWPHPEVYEQGDRGPRH